MHLRELASKSRVLLLGALLVVTASLSLAPSKAEAALTIPIDVHKFVGTLSINSFATADIGGVQKLVAIGTLQGTKKNDKKGVLPSVVVGNITIPVNIAGQTCPILQLDLGPLNLDLLGLQVDLSAISLDITAVPGGGNLLGNLLCTVAGLLDPGSLTQLVALLNQILALLG